MQLRISSNLTSTSTGASAALKEALSFLTPKLTGIFKGKSFQIRSPNAALIKAAEFKLVLSIDSDEMANLQLYTEVESRENPTPVFWFCLAASTCYPDAIVEHYERMKSSVKAGKASELASLVAYTTRIPL